MGQIEIQKNHLILILNLGLTEEEESAAYHEEYRPPINFNQPTPEGVVAEMTSEIGTIEYHLIPTRSYWLRMVRHDWGTTDEEIKACIVAHPQQMLEIEVCGCYKGYGVIVRDIMRHPIIAISRALDDYVSPFYHELEAVSLGLKLALKYNILKFNFTCVSEKVAAYVMWSWNSKLKCGCPPRDNLQNPGEKKYYCVECSKSELDDYGEGKDADKILPLVDEIFYNGLKLESEGYRFYLFPAKLSRAKGVLHLANSGMDQELRLDEIEEDEKFAEILYKEVYNHGTEQELLLEQDIIY
ncbi:hypothetical protein MKW94_003665 [Papaver nudicaule]|uniref:Uncharacterized protein n=1 Tax=Papaver nudicaule TaxID=74823 RepID=A0AA41V7Q1_PAPNU|nr:hypothetical protein [Papaver nudicaule]